MARLFLIVLLLLPMAALAEVRVLVLGDSILAWNGLRGQSIPQQMDRFDKLSVQSRAASGAVFSGRSGLFGREIMSQLPQGTWDVIVVNGGGNDLKRDCGCGSCAGTLDRLVSVDGQRGEMPGFLDLLSQRAERVIWLDYFPVSVRGGPFAPCRDALATLARRMQKAARQRARVTFLDAGQVYDPRDMSLYARDLIHPTPKGGARIARLIASHIPR